MRLKSLTNLNTLLLVAVCVALAATLWWSQRALERPYQLMERYLSLSQQFQGESAQNIAAYLESGDALRHSAALQSLAALELALAELPTQLAENLRPSLNELQRFSADQLLAAGKLSGDPQGLLLQAEREMEAALEQLANYADSGEPATAAGYRRPLFSAARHLTRLGHARAKLVSSGRGELVSEVERELAALQKQAQALSDLPLLGVAETEQSAGNSFAGLLGLDESSDSSQAEDRGIALKRDLANLIKRYPAELQRTRELIEQRGVLASSTRTQIDQVQQALAALEPLVRAEHGRIQGEVQLILGLMIGLILLIALIIDRIQRRLTKILTHLVPSLSAWAQGDFATDIRLGSQIRELADIEASLNRLRAYLVDLVGTIRQHAEQVVGSSRTLAELSGGLHGGAERQAGDTAQIHDALGELQATIQQVAGDASQAADASRDANRALEQGQQVIGHSLTGLHELVDEVQGNAQAIERLAEETATIGNVLTVIRGIAEQTNLLALNAAIEAARAGELGRGFAVVADEVRNLAKRTQDSVEEIRQVIEGLQNGTKEVVSTMHSSHRQAQGSVEQVELAVAVLQRISQAVSVITDMNLQIASAAEEQSSVAEEINRNVASIRDVTESISGQADESAQISQNLNKLANHQQSLMDQFRV